MDAKLYMIIDLEKRGDKQMFVTERVSSIYQNKKGLWTVRFSSSPRVFNYNPSRLLYLTHPDTINLGEKGLYINNKCKKRSRLLQQKRRCCYSSDVAKLMFSS